MKNLTSIKTIAHIKRALLVYAEQYSLSKSLSIAPNKEHCCVHLLMEGQYVGRWRITQSKYFCFITFSFDLYIGYQYNVIECIGAVTKVLDRYMNGDS